jgi:hypothetical protein
MAPAMSDPAPGGRYLIYLLCIGEAFRRYAAMAITSIRRIGGWRQEIVLMSDAGQPLLGCPDVTVIDIVTGAKARYPWLTLRSPALHHLKTELEYHVDLSRYDYVLYVDSDVLVNSSRLTDIVGALSREQAIVVQQDRIAVSSGLGFAGGKLLSKAEQERWGDFAVNAGVVGFPMTPIGRRLLRDWRQLNVDQQFRSRDQGNLTTVLLRKYYGQWGYLTEATMGLAVERYPHTFVHFTVRKTTLMEDYYTRILGLTLPG